MKKFLIILTLYLSASSGIHSQVHQDWVSLYDYDNNADAAWSITVDASGNVYVTGANGFPSDIATVKYNSLGEQQWAARYSGPGSNHDVGYAIAVDASGNVYVTGASGNYYDIATIKYNSLGVEQWVARYNGQCNYVDYAYSLAIDNKGNVYVGGTTTCNGGGKDFVTLKYDSLVVENLQTLPRSLPHFFVY